VGARIGRERPLNPQNQFSAAVDGLYAAAAGQSDWHGALDVSAAAIGFSHWSVYATDRQAWAVATPEYRLPLTGLWSRSYDASAQRAYEREYYKLAPNRRHYLANPGRQICHDQMLMGEAEMDRHPFYDWAERTHGVRYMAIGVTDPRHPIGATLGLTRARSRGPITAEELARLDVLLEHFERAVQLEHHLGKALAPGIAALDFLDRNPTGILILDGLGRVVVANRAARHMAERADGFSLRTDGIAALRPQDDAGLQRLIAGAVRVARGEGLDSGGSLRLPRRSGARDYVVTVSPLSRRESILAELLPAACVLINDPQGPAPQSAALLRQIYGITSAEQRLIKRLIAGDTPEQAARALGVSMPTVRSHLASVFRKTDTSRQADLIRLLATLPWWSHGEDQA
jgi:DNA-binding CsgD family transcriptional regulator